MKKQQGLTLTGLLFFGVFVGVVGLLVMKIGPVYLQHYYVLHAGEQLKKLPQKELQGDPSSVAIKLKKAFKKQLYTNEIRHIDDKAISIKHKRFGYELSVKYVVEKPLIGNIRLLFDFHPIIEIRVATGSE